MKFRFLSVSARSPEPDEQALNAFCGQNRVVSVDREFVSQAGDSFWAICVCYVEGADPIRGALGGKRDRVDYREVLSEQDFAVYAELRSLRKSIAEQEGNRNNNVGFRLALAQEQVDAALDQMTILSAAQRRQKQNALRQVSRSRTEGLPERRPQRGE